MPSLSEESETNATPIWVLLGTKHGDNQQLLGIAESLQTPFRTIPLRFNRLGRWAPVVLGATQASWHAEVPLTAPWPDVVLAAGRKSVPAARWIRKQSGGRTRLVHVNRPWAPLAWFDLIVSTPQYALPDRANVQANLLPFVRPASDVAPSRPPPAQAADLPRPWTVVLVGGRSRPFVFDEAAAADLARRVNAEVRTRGGSAWVLDSPRTPAAALQVLAQSLEVPSRVVRFREGEGLYDTLLGLADHLLVTSDSASMLAEALLTNRPVSLFQLPQRPDWKWRIASAWRAAAVRSPSSLAARGFETAVNLGLLTSVRDLDRLHEALRGAGLFNGSGRALALAECERQATLQRIAALIDGCGRVPVGLTREERLKTTRI